MATKLKKYFPMIREREEVLASIHESQTLLEKFESWEEDQQEEFLDFCTGVKGLKLLYDGFFKEVMNPEYVPERFNDFLSELLGQQVTVLKVLPNDSTRLAQESSLLLMDIVVELEDGSIANVEMQKVGYLFPGERCACYSADLLLRQYKRVRGEKKQKFSYHNVKDVYTIVLFEKSPQEFHDYPKEYRHFFEQKSDTGLKMNFLQKYVFIPLDIFQENQQNKGMDISNRREAWLTLFSCDNPEMIITLIERYPEFRGIYEEGYQICLNTERVMNMFSEELYEMDRNMVEYMVDIMQDKINEQKKTLEKLEMERAKAEDALKQTQENMGRMCEKAEKAEQKCEKAEQEREKAEQKRKKAEQKCEKAEQERKKAEQKRKKAEQEREKALRGNIKIFQSLNLPEADIIQKICELYDLTEEHAKTYLPA